MLVKLSDFRELKFNVPDFYIRCGFFTILLFSINKLIAQPTHFTNSNYWKHQKKELLFGVGASNFLGDLGGRDQIGTDYSPVDLDWVVTRPSVHIGYRIRLRPWFLMSTRFQYSILRGDDALTQETFRHYRNLHFRTHHIENSTHCEFILYNNEYFGHRYKIKNLKGMRHANTLLYIFSGISVFAYIPQAQYKNDWINLRPLHTEGQGLDKGPDEYGLFNLGIPFGIGLKIGLDAIYRLSFELSYTKTFTDYLDDVSGSYYDPNEIEANYGHIAAYLSDPSSKEFPTWTKEGEIRGDPDDKDAYLFFNITLIRNVTYKRSIAKFNYPRF